MYNLQSLHITRKILTILYYENTKDITQPEISSHYAKKISPFLFLY